MKSILFITTSNLTTNPRLLKELQFLNSSYKCTFIGFKLGNWSDKIDDQYLKGLKNIDFHYLSATRKPLYQWAIATIVHLLSRKAYTFLKDNICVSAYASNKRSILLKQFLLNHHEMYDLIIAHNLGALYPAWWFSLRMNIPFAFDIEDYHPGEKINNDQKNEIQRREFLMKKLLPKAAFISYASPLIGEQSIRLIGKSNIRQHLLINNSFKSDEFVPPKNTDGKLKLVWFSQYVDQGRGLEIIINVLDKFAGKIELHLYGHPRPAFIHNYIDGRKYIKIHGTLDQIALHRELAQYDVGLAFENASVDQNRNICLTNKIWAYLQAGLFILATDTDAQRKFMEYFPWSGKVVSKGMNEIDKNIFWLLDNSKKIRLEKMERYNKSRSLSWESDGSKLKGTIDVLLGTQ